MKLWTDIATAAGVNLSAEQIGRLGAYLDGLIETNKTLNLTRIVDRQDAAVKHVGDALTLLPFLPSPSTAPISPPPPRGGGDLAPAGSAAARWSLADVGTGGGIPGVILAIVRPDIAVTLIDSTAKKLAAVASICDRIGLTNVTTLHARIEQTPRQFDVITARGVAELTKLLGWCRGLMKPTSVLLAMKGPRVVEEMENLTPAQRKQFQFEQHGVTVPELSGHVIVRAALKSR